MSLDTAKVKTAIFEFKLPAGKDAPALEDFKRSFAIGGHEVDEAYGFIPTRDGTFWALVTKEAALRVEKEGRAGFVSYIDNFRIGPEDRILRPQPQKPQNPFLRRFGF